MELLQRILQYDQLWTARLLANEQPRPLRTIFAVIGITGDSWFWAAGLLLTWWVGDPIWKILAIKLAAGVLVVAVLVGGIKWMVRRRRPEGEWGSMYRRTDPHSFPSGHAARASLLAVMVGGLAPPWLAALLAIWAPLVAVARVMMGLHYLADIIAGALLGLVAGVVVLLIL